MRLLPLALGAALLLSGGAVLAHVGATGIVKERMDDMKLMGRSLKRIDERMRSKRLPDIAREADAIGAAAARMPALFPVGSRDGHTEALATVWERWPEFTASARSLADASEKLALAARAGQEAEAASQLRLIKRSCSECHATFKARN